MTSYRWLTNEPRGTNIDCAVYASNGGWMSADCTDTVAYICEISSSSPGQSRVTLDLWVNSYSTDPPGNTVINTTYKKVEMPQASVDQIVIVTFSEQHSVVLRRRRADERRSDRDSGSDVGERR